MENVASMPKEAKAEITKQLWGIEPVMINAALVSAQNRKRLFWVLKLSGDKYDRVEIPQPEDKGILLKDILQPESEVSEKYYMSEKTLQRLNVSNVSNVGYVGYNKEGKDSDKSASILARDYKGMSNQGLNTVKIDKQLNPKNNQGNHSDMDLLVVAQRGRGNNNQ